MAEVTRPSKATNDCAGQLLLESGSWDGSWGGWACCCWWWWWFEWLYVSSWWCIHSWWFCRLFYIVPLPWPCPLSESYKRLPLCDGPFWPWQPWRPIGHPRFGVTWSVYRENDGHNNGLAQMEIFKIWHGTKKHHAFNSEKITCHFHVLWSAWMTLMSPMI